jgi:hypothetical protein
MKLFKKKERKMYTVYSLYYGGKPMEVATANGFVGSTRQTITKCFNDHSKNIARSTHSNKNLNASKGRHLEMYILKSGLSLEECNNLLRTLRPKANTGWNLTKACRSTAERHLGKTRPQKTKKLISAAMTGKHLGKTYSEEHKANISKGSQNKFRPVDVYDYTTEQPLTKNVSLRLWAKLNGYSYSNLYLTLNCDFSKPHHHLTNKYHTRLIYARWSEEA